MKFLPRHSIRTRILSLFLSELFYLIAVLDFADKNFGRLETWNEVFVDNNGSVAGNISCDFLFPLFVDKASKPTNVNIVAAGHGVLDNGKKGFYGCRYIGFVDSCLVSDLIDYVCFRHGAWVLRLWVRDDKINLRRHI